MTSSGAPLSTIDGKAGRTGARSDERALLKVENLAVRFDGAPRDINVVDDVSFSVSKGKTLCIVGSWDAERACRPWPLWDFFRHRRHVSWAVVPSSTVGTS